jgi:hypothetical protein
MIINQIFFFSSEEDLVVFEILAESLKLELDNILKANHNYKTDYYRFNRKKFLLSYCFDTNNAGNEYEVNAYLDEIVSLFDFIQKRNVIFHSQKHEFQ